VSPDELPENLRLYDRFALQSSIGRYFDGLWIGTPEEDREELFERVEEALALIRTHDARRYARLRRDLCRVWVRLLEGDLASYSAALRACQLDARYVRDPGISAAELATTIVHEATHARIERRVSYTEDRRARIEAACVHEEALFARRLPGGESIRSEREAWLAAPPAEEIWTAAAFEQRRLDGQLERLRYIGAPEWLMRRLPAMVAASQTLRSGSRSLRRWFARFTG
jgi:hypothetical protein